MNNGFILYFFHVIVDLDFMYGKHNGYSGRNFGNRKLHKYKWFGEAWISFLPKYFLSVDEKKK